MLTVRSLRRSARNRIQSSLCSTMELRSVEPNGTLGPRQIKARCSGQALDRMGDIVDQRGIDLGPFRNSPLVLWNHDPAFPIARATWIGLEGGSLTSIAQFPPEGTDDTADRVYRMIKADMPLDVSIGFMPIEFEPINATDRWGGTLYKRVELLEWSIVSVGAQRDSHVIGKSIAGVGTRSFRDEPEMTYADRIRHAQKLRARLGIQRLAPMVIAAESQYRLGRW
jgi:HK97 family phage prohead protease